MPREPFKNRDADGGDFEVSWDAGHCWVGTLTYLDIAGNGERVGVGAHPEFTADELDRLIGTLQRARREAYGSKPPLAVTMEILERGRTTDDTIGGSLIVPNDVRINGVSVLTQGGIKVHDVELPTLRELATVTVTLPVRMLTIGAEGDINHDDAAAANTG